MKNSKFYLFGLSVITVITAVIISCEKDEDSKPPVGITNRIEIKADSIKNILYRDAKAYGSVGDYKNITFSQYGHCWDTLETPTIDNNKTEFQNLTAKSVFTSNLTSLKPDKTYYIRSYAKTNNITIYSEIANFQTRALEAPVVTTDSTSQIASTSANIWGAIALDGGTDISAKGVCWGITENPTLQNQHAEFTGTQDTFKVPVTGLEKYTTYYARIYAVNQTGTGYGSNVTFKTLAEQPQLTTSEVTSITAYTATSGGSITSNGGAEITTRGICWGLDANPTTSNNQCVASVSTNAYSCNLTNLQPGKTYHARAFATNIAGTSYGNDVIFTTPPVLPTVTTTQITDVTANSATTGGNVTYDGGATVTARGVCWSTSENPTITDPHTTNGSGIGTYSSSITGIAFATKYYVRAYTTNIAGTSYGEQLSFTTSAVQPTVATNSISSITGTSAIVSSEVLTDGGASITERGICWSINENPTLNENKITGGSGTGEYQCSITGLANGTTYHVRAYAINSAGTAYGTDKTFTTHSLPTVTTSDATSITTTAALTGGNVTSDGGSTITVRGVCWSTTQNPTLTNTFTSNGIGTGVFTSNISNLTPNTNYYLRAYATNSVGTSYGDEKSFKTLGLIAITTVTPTNITATTATCGGSITSDGGASITARGIVWSTSENPTVDNNLGITNNGTGIGSYTSSLTSLTKSSTYYIRAYATNVAGTVYGSQQTITTLNGVITLTTTTPTNITTTTATSGGNITSDGGASITSRGVVWHISPNPTIETNTGQTSDGNVIGSYTSNLTMLTANTKYYIRAYATNSLGVSYGTELSLTTLDVNQVSDIEKNVYNTITIGTQVWMKENLRTTKYNDGSLIDLAETNADWGDYTPAYCWPYNNTGYATTYGALYNWYAVNTGKLCPTGWHVPTDEEWTTLTTYLGGETVAGGKLKEIGTAHWTTPNTGATNETGFTALPGGYRYPDGGFNAMGNSGQWWSSGIYDTYDAWNRTMYYTHGAVDKPHNNKRHGFSVRCLKN